MAIITAHFLLNMRYMEVYPNGTTMVVLTTLGVVIENPVIDSTIKDDDSFLYTPGTEDPTQSLPYYDDTHINGVTTFDCDIENVLPRPPQAFRRELVTATVDIRDMLEETFWA
ncbi:hypothetical protein Clacol_010623 [Clathrus columnatus]|uniref:Uncharacterized protein n=1 Tax=Clathrus columnatus TaxID=1419009 RepID=A0AAV5A5U1_9AGAM|nr:hypothetical protein Clacol_003243 [Clathrus columnatus]GJJ16325.1 hypothetical protein Clacol_010623 [Clathrus columnatus]